MIGGTVSHYKVLTKLGEGGMGVVYKAQDTRLDRTVALKFLSPQVLGGEGDKSRFVREAKATAAMTHPNICTVYEIDEAAGQTFIAMECVEGQTLKSKIDSGPLKLNEALDIAIQVGRGLQKAHDTGIVHRDIKPANIMVTLEGHAKVMDFGLAKLVGRAKLTRTGATVGTVAYMSPEQTRGEEVDHRTDIWSFGVVLFEMLAGQPPFQGDYEAVVMYSVMNEEPKSLAGLRADVPAELEEIVCRALEKDPDRRYQRLDEMIGDVVRCREELARRAKREGIPDRESSPSVAVLPFRDMSPEKDQDYFCEGMAEEIINALSHVENLRVIARTSAFAFKDKQEDAREIGKKLGVSALLEGSVRKAGDRLRITAQLIKVADGSQMWSERYDRVLEDIFVIQSEIAEQVSRQLEVTLVYPGRGIMRDRPTEDMDAYQAYLRGLGYSHEVSVWREDMQVAIKMYERAVELDPGFALAWAKLSLAHGSYYHFGHDQTPGRMAKAREAAERAQKLAPEHPEVHRALGYYHYRYRREYHRALEEFAAAARGRPSDSKVLADMAYVLRRMGRWDESNSNLERAVELDPRNARILHQLSASYIVTRQYQKADRTLDRSISLAPDQFGAYQTKVINYWLWHGSTERSGQVLERMPRQDDPSVIRLWYDQEFFMRNWQAALERISSASTNVFIHQGEYCPKALLECWCYLRMGQEKRATASCESARVALEDAVKDRPDDPRIHSALGLAYAALGRDEEAIREGERAVALVPVAQDAISGPGFVMDLALICTQVGEHDAALDRIGFLLSIPCALSIPRLCLDPRWDPLREHRRFRRLLEERAGGSDSAGL